MDYLSLIPKSNRCGVCFQTEVPADEICDVCGVAVHHACCQFEGNEAPDGSISPFRVDVDKVTGIRQCGYCRAATKANSKGIKEMPPRNLVVCELCGRSGDHALFVALSGAATKWVHICCARFLPGSSIGLTGARRYAGNETEATPCFICESPEGVTTSCYECEGDNARKAHVLCALLQGNYGLKAVDALHGSRRILCPEHKFKPSLASPQQSSNALTYSLTAACCGVCLSTENLASCRQCDGCSVKIHPDCVVSQEASRADPFYCERCMSRNNRGSVDKCVFCPHTSPILASKFYENDPAHVICVSGTSPEHRTTSSSSGNENQKCYLCGTKQGILIPCSDCSNYFHSICALFLCEGSRHTLPVTKCLEHCDHPHQYKTVIPLTLEFSIGTAIRPYRREVSAVFTFAYNKGAKEDSNIFREWGHLSEAERNSILEAPAQPPTDNLDIPEIFMKRTCAAVALAWEQTKKESFKKRSRPLSFTPAVLPSISRNGRSQRRKSSTSYVQYDEDDDDEKYSKPARPLQAKDNPIEIAEVWPLLEPIFRRPPTLGKIYETLQKDRTCDEILTKLGPGIVADRKLYPDQPWSTNPYVPQKFVQFPVLERKKNESLLDETLQFAYFDDVNLFASKRCCLGRKENDSDSASLTLLITRALTLPSNLLLIRRKETQVDGLAHCTYLEGILGKIAVLKITAKSIDSMCFLFEHCLIGELSANDELDHVYITSLDSNQEVKFWKRLFPELQTEFEEEFAGMMSCMNLKAFDWVARLKSVNDWDSMSSGEAQAALEATWKNQLEVNHHPTEKFKFQIALSPENPQDVEPSSGDWAFSFQIDQSEKDPVAFKQVLSKTTTLHLLNPVVEVHSDFEKTDDAKFNGTLARELEVLQKELNSQINLNNTMLEKLKKRIIDDQVRWRQIQQTNLEVEPKYREKKKKLKERMDLARLQAELDNSARCEVCLVEDSYENNPIIICEDCTWSAHQSCLNLETVPEGDWFCHKCKEKGEEDDDDPKPRKHSRRNRKSTEKMSSLLPSASNTVETHIKDEFVAKELELRALTDVSTNNQSNSTPPNEVIQAEAPGPSSTSPSGLKKTRKTRIPPSSSPEPQKTTNTLSSSYEPGDKSDSNSREDDTVQYQNSGGNDDNNSEDSTLFCVCRSEYEDGRFMLCCDQCSNWFHPTCIGLNDCTESKHTNCVVMKTGVHTLNVTNWAFKCPRCSPTKKCSLTPNVKASPSSPTPITNNNSNRKRNKILVDEEEENSVMKKGRGRPSLSKKKKSSSSSNVDEDYY